MYGEVLHCVKPHFNSHLPSARMKQQTKLILRPHHPHPASTHHRAPFSQPVPPPTTTFCGPNFPTQAKFRGNRVEESIEDFDAALSASPSMRPYLWQRGLSLYYVGQYEEGAKQFRDDVAVNPNDTEESIWWDGETGNCWVRQGNKGW